MLLHFRAAFISADTDYSITLNQTTGGTIAIEPNKDTAKAGETVTLTATPTQTDTDYYVFTSWTVFDDKENKITVTNNQFTMPASDVKIEAKFTRQYKVTFSVNGTPSASTRLEEGASITFPANPADIYGKKFVGWTTSSINGTQSTAPDVLLSEGTMPTEDMTYYAVFATEVSGTQETTKTYGFETETDDDWIIDGPTRNNDKAATDMYAGKINSNNTYVTFKKKVNVKNFSFAFTRTSNNENYNVYIETSTDGTTWTAVETYPMSVFNSDGTFLTKSKDFDGETSLYTRFHCYNTTAVRYVDDVSITYNEDVITYTEYATTVTEPIVLKVLPLQNSLQKLPTLKVKPLHQKEWL